MINEEDFVVARFNHENTMGIVINKYLNLEEVIRLRNHLTKEIERVQKPVVEVLQKLHSNASPEIK